MACKPNINRIVDDFYGNPSSFRDFPPNVVLCKCVYGCSASCILYRDHVRRMLYHMHTAVSELGLWETVGQIPSGFTFGNVKWIIDINSHPLVYQDSHSNASFELSMQYMRFIATGGWGAFIRGFEKIKKKTQSKTHVQGSITIVVT